MNQQLTNMCELSVVDPDKLRKWISKIIYRNCKPRKVQLTKSWDLVKKINTYPNVYTDNYVYENFCKDLLEKIEQYQPLSELEPRTCWTSSSTESSTLSTMSSVDTFLYNFFHNHRTSSSFSFEDFNFENKTICNLYMSKYEDPNIIFHNIFNFSNCTVNPKNIEEDSVYFFSCISTLSFFSDKKLEDYIELLYKVIKKGGFLLIKELDCDSLSQKLYIKINTNLYGDRVPSQYLSFESWNNKICSRNFKLVKLSYKKSKNSKRRLNNCFFALYKKL